MNQIHSGFDPYQVVTDQIIEHLERGVVPWRCPWQRQVGRPRNFVSGRPYQGVNVLLLGLRSFASPYWMTFLQVQERSGKVRKGERSSYIVKFDKFQRVEEDEHGGRELRPGFFLKGYRVFNATQIEGIEFPSAEAPAPASAKETVAKAVAIERGMPAPPTIRKGRSIRASYDKQSDLVDVPPISTFESAEAYHLTLFHELVHSTGHPSRLNRTTLTASDGFGGKVYSEEELVAEMGAAFLAMEAQIVTDSHEQSAAYLSSWLDVLRAKEHRRWIVQAASMAGHATDWILGRKSAQPNPPENQTTPESATVASNA